MISASLYADVPTDSTGQQLAEGGAAAFMTHVMKAAAPPSASPGSLFQRKIPQLHKNLCLWKPHHFNGDGGKRRSLMCRATKPKRKGLLSELRWSVDTSYGTLVPVVPDSNSPLV